MIYFLEPIIIYLIYSLMGQAGNDIKIYRQIGNKELTDKADKLLLLQHAIGAYLPAFVFGILFSLSYNWFIILGLSAVFHLFFLCPDILDFLIWRKLIYPNKPYHIPESMPWLAINWTHTIVILLSTGNLNDKRCTRWGLVRTALLGYALLFSIIYFLI